MFCSYSCFSCSCCFSNYLFTFTAKNWCHVICILNLPLPMIESAFCFVFFARYKISYYGLMAHLHGRRQTRVLTQIRIPKIMATLYYGEHVHIAQTRTRIPIPYFCTGQESKSESLPESVSGNVNKPWDVVLEMSLINNYWPKFGSVYRLLLICQESFQVWRKTPFASVLLNLIILPEFSQSWRYKTKTPISACMIRFLLARFPAT